LLSPHPDYVLTHTAWPVSPERTRIVCEWLVTKEAIAKNADASDVVEFWDVTNRQDWSLCERAGRGGIARVPTGALSADGRLCAHVRSLVRDPVVSAPSMRRHRHRESHQVTRLGWLRAATLGANDGI